MESFHEVSLFDLSVLQLYAWYPTSFIYTRLKESIIDRVYYLILRNCVVLLPSFCLDVFSLITVVCLVIEC